MSAATDLTAALRAAGVIAADAPPPPSLQGQDRPWFIALLQGIAGWFAGLFLLVFLGMLIEPRASAVILVMGVLLLVAAWLIYRRDRDGVFLDQFALALSIAGQLAVAWGVINDNFEGLQLAAVMLALQVLIWLVMPNRIARMVAALFALIAWVYTIQFLLRPAPSVLIALEDPAGRSPTGPVLAFTTWLLTWVPVVAAAWWLIAREARWMADGYSSHARPALTGLLLGAACSGLVTGLSEFAMPGNMGSESALDWTAVFPLLSIGLAALAAYGAFRLRSPGLVGFAIFAALVHLARFYYFYGTSLLWKSLIMFVTGTCLLLLGVWLKHSGRAERAS